MKENRYTEYAAITEGYVDQRVTRAIEKAEKEAEQRAELLEKNRKRVSEQKTEVWRKTRAKNRYEKEREFHNLLGIAASDMLKQFILELQGLTLVPVGDLRDRDAVTRRKDQLTVIKETLAAVQVLLKFQAQLAEEYNLKKEDAKAGEGDNVLLFKQADKLLRQAAK